MEKSSFKKVFWKSLAVATSLVAIILIITQWKEIKDLFLELRIPLVTIGALFALAAVGSTVAFLVFYFKRPQMYLGPQKPSVSAAIYGFFGWLPLGLLGSAAIYFSGSVDTKIGYAGAVAIFISVGYFIGLVAMVIGKEIKWHLAMVGVMFLLSFFAALFSEVWLGRCLAFGAVAFFIGGVAGENTSFPRRKK